MSQYNDSFYESDYTFTSAELNFKHRRGKGGHALDSSPVEDLPKRQKMKTYGDWWDDGYRDGAQLRGLHGILRQGLGRPWSKVYSEILAHIKENYPSRLWTELHHRIEWCVELHPMHVGDGIYVTCNGRPFYAHCLSDEFMVHPETGCLMHPKEEWVNMQMVKPGKDRHRYYFADETRYDGRRYYRKIEGIWYEVLWECLPSAPKTYWTPSSSTSFYERYNVENDWLYKLNIRDAVLRERVRSDYCHSLALCHGFFFRGKMLSHKVYQERQEKLIRYTTFPHYRPSLIGGERYVYAKALRQLNKNELRALGVFPSDNQNVPSLVNRHHKKHR